MHDVGGRLVAAAQEFVTWQDSGEPEPGATGVRWLARRLEDFTEREVGLHDDHRFVEGAGAVLGLLLIEHYGGQARARDGTHRVQVGRFGWFDPFSAIEDALESDDPRDCLSQYLAIAEQEAQETGPVAGVVALFAEVLAAERPDLEVTAQFELTVDLDNGASVDLARLEKVARDQDRRAAAEAARRLISMLPGDQATRATLWEEAAKRLLPRLVSTRFLRSLPSPGSVHRIAVGHDVHIALQLRYGPRARYVRHSEVQEWTSSGDALRCAIGNLVARSQSLRVERLDNGILRVRQGDGLDAARLMLPDLALRLRRLHLGSWVVAAPHRDVLLLAPSHCAPLLAEHATDAAERAPHPISDALFSVTETGLFPVHAQALA